MKPWPVCLAYQIESHVVLVLQGFCSSVDGIEASITKSRHVL